MKKEPFVSLVIPSYNGKDMTVNLLESLKKVDYRNYETIVVDNGSNDGCYEYVKKHFPNVKSLKIEKNVGFTGGANFGIKHCKGDYIIMMNNDMLVDAQWLSELVKVADSDEEIGIVGSVFMDDNNKIDRLGYVEGGKFILRFKPLYRGVIYKGQFPPVIKVDHTFGLVKRIVFNKIGNFDNKNFIYWEDVDLCYRAKRAGFKIVTATRAKIWHKKGQTMKKFPQANIFHYNKNQIRFILKNLSPFRKLINLPLLSTQICVKILAYSLKGEFRSSFVLIRSVIWNIQNFRDYI